MLDDRARRSFRLVSEMIMRNKPYSMGDINSMDVLTFFEVMKEAEKIESQRVSDLEKQKRKRD
jgi:hypothetical protein